MKEHLYNINGLHKIIRKKLRLQYWAKGKTHRKGNTISNKL